MRTRTAVLFAAGFLFLWGLLSILLLVKFKEILLTSFEEQMQARASLVAEKTNVLPKIVPLPQGSESFVILYVTDSKADTLFKPSVVPFKFPSVENNFPSVNGWTSTRIIRTLENGGSVEVVYALPSESIDSKIRQLRFLIWLVFPVGCLLAGITGFWLSSKLLRPVRLVINRANSIDLEHDTGLLDEPPVNDELKELIVSFNRMLQRIKEQSERQVAFFASASHELRTPLSLMQTRLQVLMQDEYINSEVQAVYNEQLKEVKQLNKMVNDFLLLSELRTGNMKVLKVLINLSDILPEIMKKYKDKALSKNLHFKISYEPEEELYEVQADEDKLFIIISNLLDNAVKYAPASGLINILFSKTEDSIFISISNPIRDDINPDIADLKNKFYHSKPLHGEGFGLGLWIANQLAVMQGFELFCTMSDKERFEASLVLPALDISSGEFFKKGPGFT